MEDWAIEYVRSVITELGISTSELATRAGVSSTTLTRPLNAQGNHPFSISRRTLEKIRDATGIPFPGEVAQPTPKPDALVQVKVFDVTASAGHGALVEAEQVVDEVGFSPNYIRSMTVAKPNDLSIIGVKGDSMEPTLLDGDQVLVDMSKRSLDFDGLFVLRYGDALHVKRVGRHRQRGFVTITSDNDQYRQIEAGYDEVDVIGRVLWFGRKV